MDLVGLYKKVPVNLHSNIKVIGDRLVYVTTSAVYTAYVTDRGEIVPADIATRNLLAGL